MQNDPNILLSAREVHNLVLYSVQNLMRLESAEEFPSRIHLGPRRRGWPKQEILQWMQAKIDARQIGPMSPKVVIGPDDRFIGKKELKTLVLYSGAHVRILEIAGKFPGRIQIGENRVAWLEREIREWTEAAGSHRKVSAFSEQVGEDQ